MLAANVLCLKKKKKRTYCLSSASSCKGYGAGTSKNERSRGGTVTMMQITEDTPPDMLAGAMDLTVHLPSGKAVKMSVERSTPMMDLLVQITTTNQLQLSNHTLQVLGMAPSSEHSDKVLPFKPNTPIGTLDTQHIRVLPKGRTLPAPKYVPPGHQPFESTFRLKVHLPRNQLYVTRVSRNVLLEDIMKKVCEEKNLDPMKYDFKHPGNLDQVLDPKLTLSDYQITEIYVVAKGTTNLSQAFSAADIMVLRKEEERKQMHNKTGGGVFNLIFKRGKSSMGSGSVSSDNRSISPTHSDDSRSVTPPAVQAPSIVTPPKKDPPPERPKPPQRKRRPAPKPPQIHVAETSNEKPELSSEVPTNTASKKAGENGLTICHSRNSSDSSGYHEASILSDHCANTSLPRSRPKSAFVGDLAPLQSTSNLSKMSTHSRSTTSLVAGRKKKAAPPPPPVSPASSVVAQSDKPSPLVASQSDYSAPHQELSEVLESTLSTNPTPIPRPRNKVPRAPPRPRPKSDIFIRSNEDIIEQVEREIAEKLGVRRDEKKETLNKLIVEDVVKEILMPSNNDEGVEFRRPQILATTETTTRATLEFHLNKSASNLSTPNKDFSMEEILSSLEAVKPFIMNTEKPLARSNSDSETHSTVANAQKESKPPEIVGVIPKTPKEEKKFSSNNNNSFGKKRCFQIGKSLEQKYDPDTASMSSKSPSSSRNSVTSALNALDDEISDLDESMFTGSLSKASVKKRPELFGIRDNIDSDVKRKLLQRDTSVVSLHSCEGSIPGLRKWNNSEDLDSISVSSYGVRNRWVVGDASDTESVASSNLNPAQSTPLDSIPPRPLETNSNSLREEKSLDSTDSGIAQDTDREKEDPEEDFGFHTPPPPPILDDIPIEIAEPEAEPEKFEPKPVQITPIPPAPKTPPPTLKEVKKVESVLQSLKQTGPEAELVDIDWQYQLPSPPKAFRDSSPTNLIVNETNSTTDFKDSVVTCPELFEKLRTLEDNQSEKGTLKSEVTSIASEEPLNTLSLEHLEKRKSLVYNRELATSLKMTDNIETSDKTMETFESSLAGFQTAYNNASSPPKQPAKPVRTVSSQHTLPNFKITTYDVPKQNIKVFEDDTISSNTHTTATLTKTAFGHSMETISFSKRSSFDSSNKEKEYTFYKSKPPQTGPTSVSRSGSFSTDRSPLKPVSRSKSTLTLNKYQVGRRDENNISRSNSLFDVSGLHSLEVMKLIQNKLSTPTGSIENINERAEPPSQQQFVPQKPLPKLEVKREDPPELINTPKATSPEPVKKYYYRGPPAVNMSTWSERPKVPVAVKEDDDYKLGNNNNKMSSKLIVNTTNHNITNNNSIEVRSNGHGRISTNEVSVNVNGTEQITQKSGNVVIKIGGGPSYIKNNLDSQQRFMGPTGYRKPFSNINRNDKPPQRPHSIALPSDFDISRVPVVRSVEFKKPYKDLHTSNTSITHLNQDNDDFRSLNNYSFAEKFRSTENLRNIEKQESELGKRVFRVGSFKPIENMGAPTVRGFKSNNNNNNEINNRLSWNPLSTYNTLPAKPKVDRDFGPNQHVPFSQSTLRRTVSSKLYVADQKPDAIKPPSPTENPSYNSLPPNVTKNKLQPVSAPPPPPPLIALRKVVAQETSQSSSSPTDTRDLLLESIRNFGGKKGLKAVKA